MSTAPTLAVPMRTASMKTVTLGCKVNQYETEYVRQGLASIGYRNASDEEVADLCVVNTCTVTAEGDSKSRQVIRQLAKRNPGTRIIVMGCYATRAPEEVAALPGVAEVVTDKRELPDLLARAGVVDIPTGISTFAGRQRAYVKVQDGCLLRCSFCIIPHVRPEVRSRPIEHIEAEVRRLLDDGYRELILTGIHLGHYGVEQNRGRPKHEWLRLANLLERLAAIEGDFRLRLSSIEGTEITRELLGVMAAHGEKIAPHLHVSMQSGSDAVLRRMHRRWGAKRVIDRCLLARDMLDTPGLTTDIIVGFPGETDQDFQDTCDAARAIGFHKVHIFPFSARRGTPAATMIDQVVAPVKAARCDELARVETELHQRYCQLLAGKPLRVLVESPLESPGRMVGTACRGVAVELDGTIAERRTFRQIVAGELQQGRIQAC